MQDLPPSICGLWAFTFAEGLDPADTRKCAVMIEPDGSGRLTLPGPGAELEVSLDSGPGQTRVRLGWSKLTAQGVERGSGHLRLKSENAARGVLEEPGRPARKFVAERQPEPTPPLDDGPFQRLALDAEESLEPTSWDSDRLKSHRTALFAEQTDAMNSLDTEAVMGVARQMGLVSGNTLNLGSEDEGTILADHVLYDRPLAGPSVIQQRLRRLAPAGDEAVAEVRAAMASARFCILRVEETHPGEGLIVRDLCDDRRLPLADRGLSRAEPGTHLAARLLPLGSYTLTTGAGFPLPAKMAERLAATFENTLGDPRCRDLPHAEARRSFAVAVVKLGFDHKLTTTIRYERAD